jgi:2,4-diketo-3-deoxy-L-fuconate hydrolase
MKLVRYGNPGKEKPGLIDANGKLRDLSAVIKDIGPDQLGDAALAKLRKLKTDKLPLVKGSPRMGCPVEWCRQVHRHWPELRGPCGRVRCCPFPKSPLSS